jgi:hypothetical protein
MNATHRQRIRVSGLQIATLITLPALYLGQAGCETARPTEPDMPPVVLPIYKGTAVENSHLTGSVVIGDIRFGGFCSGSLASSTWALTAKHCIVPQDSDGNRLITVPEGADNVIVGNGPDASGNPVALSAVLVVLHPQQDIALVKLAQPGFDASRLPGDLYDLNTPPFGGRGVRFMKISQTPTKNLQGQEIYRTGYAVDGQGGMFGTLRSGWTTADEVFEGWYRTPKGEGAVCGGDSGGPDYAWLNHPQQPSGWYLVGVHINGDQNCTGNVDSSMDGAAELRSWIIQAADAF